jgi:hypothetical protein
MESAPPTERPPQAARPRARIARRVQSAAPRLHRFELGLHAVSLVIVTILFGFAVFQLGSANAATCALHDKLNEERGLLLAAFTAGGFVVGRVVGLVRFHIREGLHGQGRAQPKPGVVLDLAFVLFLALAAVLLGYETWSLANGGHPPPITSYVRCAAYHQFLVAAGTASTIGFMVSNWLWFPSK